MTDFDKIVLSDDDVRYLEMARYGAILHLHPVNAGHLLKLGFRSVYKELHADRETGC